MSPKSERLRLILVVILTALARHSAAGERLPDARMTQREVAITFDDLPGVQMPEDKCNVDAFQALNKKLLRRLTINKIPAIGFVVEARLCEEKKRALSGLLKMWLDACCSLGNHTRTHLDLNNTQIAVYEADIISGETITNELLRPRGEKIKYFRFPYLHAGKDIETKRAVETFLVARNYRIAPVTIDNEEWVFAEAYAQAMRRRDIALSKRIAAEYVTYMEKMFEFFEKLSVEVVGYEVKQILLLHDNPLNADYLDQLVEMIRRRGYSFITLDQALQDPAYGLPDTYAGPQGISWLHRWAISKGSKMKEEPREPEWIKRLSEGSSQ